VPIPELREHITLSTFKGYIAKLAIVALVFDVRFGGAICDKRDPI